MSMAGEPQPAPPPPPPTETRHHPDSRKRPLDSSATTATANNVSRIRSSSNYFEMRSLLKELRPHFMEADSSNRRDGTTSIEFLVLRTPDFRNCKAAQEIREKMRLLRDLYMLMIEEPALTAKLNNFPQQAAPGQPPSNRSDAKSPECKPIKRQRQQQQPPQPEIDTRGTYIIGGSTSERNFITYHQRHKPVYCGITKESFRAAQVKSQGR